MTVVLLAVQVATSGDGPAFTAVLQTAIRPNTYIGLSIPFALYRQEGLTIAAHIVPAVVPSVNVISVAALVRYGGHYAGRSPSLLPAVRLNPLILSRLAGPALNLDGLRLPPAADEPLADPTPGRKGQ